MDSSPGKRNFNGLAIKELRMPSVVTSGALGPHGGGALLSAKTQILSITFADAHRLGQKPEPFSLIPPAVRVARSDGIPPA